MDDEKIKEEYETITQDSQDTLQDDTTYQITIPPDCVSPPPSPIVVPVPTKEDDNIPQVTSDDNKTQSVNEVVVEKKKSLFKCEPMDILYSSSSCFHLLSDEK